MYKTMKTIKETFRNAAILMIIITVLCGFIYPLTVTGLSQIFFKDKANGSIIEVKGKKYGSELLGQNFSEEKYLWGRIMEINEKLFKDECGVPLMYAQPINISTSSEEFKKLVRNRVENIKNFNQSSEAAGIPVDLVTCSGSGLDPQISYKAAIYQIDRIAKARNISNTQVKEVIDENTTNRFIGIFGEKVVNVLKVNLTLDGILE